MGYKKKILVTGSSGFIGSHLVRFLKRQGHEVHGVDMVEPPYEEPDEFYLCDLRKEQDTQHVFRMIGRPEEVYNLACLMGGMGYIGNPENNFDIMVGSSQIISNILNCSRRKGVTKSFFSSSACVYNMDLQMGGPAALSEKDAYPAMPDLVYGWQKLFGEQMYRAFRTSEIDIRIARFHNIFGPEGIYQGGKEKAPAALCRKVAAARDGDTIEIWGTGNQTRSFLYIDECIEGIDRLMRSNYVGPFNLGSDEKVKINMLAKMIIAISGKELKIKNVDGPEGVKARNSDNTFMRQALGWAPSAKLSDGLKETYRWIDQQVNQTKDVRKSARGKSVPGLS